MKPRSLTEKQLTKTEIDLIMERFDFQRVHDHMHKTGWRWVSSETIPTVAELKKCALQLLQEFRVGWIRLGTGGFEVITDAGGYANLLFVVAQSDACDEEDGEGFCQCDEDA